MLYKKLAICKLAHLFLEKPFGKIFLELGTPISFEINDDFESCKKILIDAMNEVEHKNTSYAKKNPKNEW